jgi:regulator of sirC expression with transglutaminase-like and TPR domain
MDATARFVEIVNRPEIPLDEASFLIAAHTYPSLDVDAQLRRLDALAAGCGRAGGFDGLVRHLFVDRGFSGNAADYHDPRSSFLNDVLDRLMGLPIALSVLTMEIGRRTGVALVGIGLPGHFLCRRLEEATYLDPFNGGERLDVPGVQALFHRLFGAGMEFLPGFLAPVDTRAILTRMLANLQTVYERSGSAADALWTVRLRLAIPGLRPSEQVELGKALGQVGAVKEAASVIEAASRSLPAPAAAKALAEARRLRSTWN